MFGGLEDALAGIQGMAALMKVDRAIRESAGEEVAPEDSPLAKKLAEATDNMVAKHGEAPTTDAERLAIYKEDIGAEMFLSLANNPNLQQMANDHCQQRGEQILTDVLNSMAAAFEGTDVTRDDLKSAFIFMIQGGMHK